MLSSDIKPLKAGLQEKTQSSLILCVTWHLFGAAFLLHRVWRGIQIGRHWQGSSSQNGYVKKIHQLSYSQHMIYRLCRTQFHSGIHTDANLYVWKD